ncbi:hypothetical protein ABPG72_015593 [Tetrahymena utriculariae]
MSKIQNDNNSNDIRILFCGNANVGKSCLIERYLSNIFLENYTPTVGIDYRAKFHIINQTKVQIKLFDIPGQNRFQDIMLSQLRKVDGVVFVYDISDMDSFLDIKHWQEKVKSTDNQNIFQLLIGNKCDKLDKQVPLSQGQEYAYDNNMNFFETSAKNGKHVEQSIMKLAEKIYCEKQKKANQNLKDELKSKPIKLKNYNSTIKKIYKHIQNCCQ